MLAARLNALRARLDALQEGRPPALGLLARARLLFREVEVPGRAALEELGRELDQAGVHTSADARLLRDVGQLTGRLEGLRRGLAQRAEAVLAAYEAALEVAEQRAALDHLSAGPLRGLEDDFLRLARVVKVAVVFAGEPGVAVPFELLSEGRPARTEAPGRACVAAAEFLARRARSRVEDSSQKRQDVELAYELVLALSADAREDRDRLRALRVELASARERLRASPTVRSLDELVRHLRHTARREPRTAYRSLRALYDRAVEAGDEQVAAAAAGAVEALLPPGAAGALLERDEARRLLGFREAGRGERPAALPPGGKAGLDDEVGDALTRVAFELDEDGRRAMALASGAGRYFDVEGALSEELVEAETRASRPVLRHVSYPTQTMTYEFTGGLDELHHFVVTHPKALVLELASGRQMVRSYLEEEPPPRPRSAKRTAVRVYVLDASGSMHGARARLRDAILVAELNAIRVKAKLGLPFDPLYFSFFNDAPSELVRVDDGAEAAAHIARLLRQSLAEGQTDISLALTAAFDSIGRARGRDPYLARATVVLVTDGEDGVDLELLRRAKQPYEGLDIALSFISLGEENQDLKALVLEQRRAGRRAFYHHLSDQEIQLCRTEFDSGFRTLLPVDAPVGPDTLERLLPHLEALEAIARGRPVVESGRAALQFDALFPSAPVPRAEVADALRRRLLDILEAIAETATLAPAERRAAEAVVLLQHLLGVYAVPVPRYLAALGHPSLVEAVERVRLLCGPFAE